MRVVKIGPKRSYASTSSGIGSTAKARVRRIEKRVSPGGNGTLAERSSRMSSNMTDSGLRLSIGGGPTSAIAKA
jgi:hypothetical protein